jgi:hypothetical protein
VEKISFVFSYTYGSLKIGLGQLFELFVSLNKNYIKRSNEFKMNMLILPYMYGSRSNLIINDRLSAIKIIAFLALRPSFYIKLNNENQVKAKEFIYFNLRSIFK